MVARDDACGERSEAVETPDRESQAGDKKTPGEVGGHAGLHVA